MELFLNLAWVFLSVGAFAWWYAAVRGQTAGRADKRAGWTILVAVGVLMILLLPAISMTDDLQALTMPAEMEHGLLLRHEAPVWTVSSLPILQTVLLMVCSVASLTGSRRIQVESYTFASVVRDGLVRAVGTRPPTGNTQIA